jgi:hypothetical protein
MCKGATPVNPSATALAGYELVWYTAATGSTLAVPSNTATRTYYVAQRLGTTGPISPRATVTVTVNDIPKLPAAVALSSLSTISGLNTITKITKVGPYIGTDIEFILTATASATADEYEWDLPEGVSIVSADETSNIITVTFEDVVPGITDLTISVKAKNECGLSATAKTLVLKRALAKSPTALVLTNATEDNLKDLTKITSVGA